MYSLQAIFSRRRKLPHGAQSPVSFTSRSCDASGQCEPCAVFSCLLRLQNRYILAIKRSHRADRRSRWCPVPVRLAPRRCDDPLDWMWYQAGSSCLLITANPVPLWPSSDHLLSPEAPNGVQPPGSLASRSYDEPCTVGSTRAGGSSLLMTVL